MTADQKAALATVTVTDGGTGFAGVYKVGDKFRAEMPVHGERRYLGTWCTADAAALAIANCAHCSAPVSLSLAQDGQKS